MSTNPDLHTCDSLPKKGVWIYRDQLSGLTRKSWHLCIHRETTEDDLQKNGYFETVGQTIWETSIEITHCPYCGNKLEEKGNLPEDFGQFRHLDFSGWDVEVQ